MIEKQYRQLCEACDDILLSSRSRDACVSIPWLHVQKEHPLQLKKYDPLFIGQRGSKHTVSLFFRKMRYLFSFLNTLRKSLLSSGKPWYCREIPSNVDVLFISHLLNADQAGDTDDFYFGSLPSKMANEGHNAAVVLINHTNISGESLVESWHEDQLPRIILSRSLGLVKELELNTVLTKEYRMQSSECIKCTESFERSVKECAKIEALSGATRVTFRRFMQFQGLIEKIKPSKIVTTFEGHAWERLAFSAAHRSDRKIECIGYAHSAISRLQHSVCRNLSHQYNPDVVLTSGEIGLSHLSGYRNIQVLGSPKEVGGKQLDQRVARNELQPCCLVIPEGLLEEAVLLFEFSLECAKKHPRIQFIWRLHPIIDFASVLKAGANFKNLPNNIHLSDAPLLADIEKSHWALYRGSTAIIQAAIAGVKPVYISIQDQIPFDPLFELLDWKVEARSVSDFSEVTSFDILDGFESSSSDSIDALQYLQKFYMPLDSNVLDRILSAA